MSRDVSLSGSVLSGFSSLSIVSASSWEILAISRLKGIVFRKALIFPATILRWLSRSYGSLARVLKLIWRNNINHFKYK